MKFFSELQEGLHISWGALRANLMRSVLTTIGIVIGIVTVTLMATALETLDVVFHEQISFMGSDVLYVAREQWFSDSDINWQEIMKRERITLPQVRRLERDLGMVRGIAPTVMYMIDSVAHGNRASGLVMLVGTNEQFLVTSGVELASGRFLTRAEAYANRALCVLGSEVAEKLFVNESPLGQMIRVGDQPFEVVGTLVKRGTVFGRMSLDNQIIIPIQRMIRGFRSNPSCTIQVKAGDPSRVEATREELRGVMRKIRKVPPGKDDDFSINQQETLVANFRKVSAIIGMAGFFITGLSLFVGGIGIMNIMFVSVTERTQEIGVRKALGARRRTILLQFLIEAASICLLGGVIALGIAWAVVATVKSAIPQVALSFPVVLLALTVAVATGLISGLLPAWRAAGMKPVDALRKE
jgi:putative ABC transport system permease protein